MDGRLRADLGRIRRGIRAALCTRRLSQPPVIARECAAPALVANLFLVLLPGVARLSSSVAQFVGTSWRWHAAGDIAFELWQDAPGHTRPWEEHEAWFSRLHDCERIILEHIERIDGHVRADDTGTIWTEVVTELTHAGN